MILGLIRKHVRKKPFIRLEQKMSMLNPDVLLTIVTEFITELSDRFGEQFFIY